MTAKTCAFHLLICAILTSPFVGCGPSDAARMEEFKKYAGAGNRDKEEDSGTAPPPPPSYVPPARGGEAGGATPPAATVSNPGSNSTDTPATPPQVDASAAPPQLAADGLSDTKAPPSAPWTEEQRRQMAIDNMGKIAKAFELFRQGKGGASYPPQYLADGTGQPLLSWRVELLPYLGYHELYKQFRRNERWDSPHNQTLIEKIPSVYQSPERFDAYTNFVVPSAGSTAFNGAKVRGIRRWEDGLENSIILVEVNDDNSVIWTQPEDLNFDPQKPREGLGGLRSDGFFAVWGGGQLTVVPTGSGDLRAAFTVDGGDLTSALMKKPAVAEAGGLAGRIQRNTTASPSSRAPVQASVGSTVGGAPSAGRANLPAAASSAGSVLANRADAQEAFREGREADAIRMVYAAIATGQEPDSWLAQYQWIPGLSRPGAIVRFGVGIEFRGPQAASARVTALKAISEIGPTQRGGSGSQKALENITGKFGAHVLHLVKNRPFYAPFLVEEPTPTTSYLGRRDDDDPVRERGNAQRARLAPGVQLIGVESERVLLAAARKHEVDVLILFDIDENAAGNRDVRVELLDVVRRKRIYTTKKLNNRRVRAAKIDLVADDPTPVVVKELSDFMQEKLTPQPMPSALRPAVAAKRVQFLANLKEKNPLRTLAEIKLYYQLGLIDLEQQMGAYTKILDSKGALTLIGGAPADGLALLEPYLPVPKLPEL